MVNGIAVTGALLALLSLPLFGLAGYESWYHLLAHANADPALSSAQVMPTLKGQLIHLHATPHTANIIANIAYAIILVLLAYIGHRHRNSDKWWRPGVTLSFSLALAFVPYMHVYDAILLMPAFCLLFLTRMPRAARALVILSLLAFLMPLSQAIHEQSMNMGTAVNLHFAAILLIGLVALYTELAANNNHLAALGGD